eukprot:TRINITY_DN11153_c0_g1_i3.p1 TRINITY_DN11153_c0_g1~~TRINITY_DN11153_c0_g1_i3.p1  ORF type:complete len:598 (-),score=95.10 TRINITY_DN11153_c0_g1_i3:446-2239(-)
MLHIAALAIAAALFCFARASSAQGGPSVRVPLIRRHPQVLHARKPVYGSMVPLQDSEATKVRTSSSIKAKQPSAPSVAMTVSSSAALDGRDSSWHLRTSETVSNEEKGPGKWGIKRFGSLSPDDGKERVVRDVQQSGYDEHDHVADHKATAVPLAAPSLAAASLGEIATRSKAMLSVPPKRFAHLGSLETAVAEASHSSATSDASLLQGVDPEIAAAQNAAAPEDTSVEMGPANVVPLVTDSFGGAEQNALPDAPLSERFDDAMAVAPEAKANALFGSEASSGSLHETAAVESEGMAVQTIPPAAPAAVLVETAAADRSRPWRRKPPKEPGLPSKVATQEIPASGKVTRGVVHEQSVWCGGHAAWECSMCPGSQGEAWCNGDCHWNVGGCYFRTDLVWCGGHAAASCERCTLAGVEDMGYSWCHGECMWTYPGLCLPPRRAPPTGWAAPRTQQSLPQVGYEHFPYPELVPLYMSTPEVKGFYQQFSKVAKPEPMKNDTNSNNSNADVAKEEHMTFQGASSSSEVNADLDMAEDSSEGDAPNTPLSLLALSGTGRAITPVAEATPSSSLLEYHGLADILDTTVSTTLPGIAPWRSTRL